MEEFVGKEKDVYLRKINISNWQTAVTEQYRVMSIPDFLVFGPDRKQLGKPTSSVETVAKLIRQAR
ncbi:MAG: hypothetical protein P8130_10630 [Deltaproteobacteria bacterium]